MIVCPARSAARKTLDDTLSPATLAELMKLAVAATQSVSELILSGFRSPTLKWERKSDGSVVTPFDLESERRIRAKVR